MRIFRGIYTTKTKERALFREFSWLPGVILNKPELICEKVLDNCGGDGRHQNLHSFSTDESVAHRYAGDQGWVLELEVTPAAVIFPQGPLESAMNQEPPGSAQRSRIDEALKMVCRDSEVYLCQPVGPDALIAVHMIGSLYR